MRVFWVVSLYELSDLSVYCVSIYGLYIDARSIRAILMLMLMLVPSRCMIEIIVWEWGLKLRIAVVIPINC